MKKFDYSYSGANMRSHVYRELEAAIINGDIEPGTALNEMSLSAQFGVSRTPIREALVQLEHSGLVNTVPNKGAVVVGVTGSDIEDIYAIRTRIEGLAARKTAENITEDELVELREIVELQEFFVNKGDYIQVWHLDSRFHDLIYDCCRSRPIKQMMSLFNTYIQKARAHSLQRGRSEDSTAEHRKVYEAIRDRNADEAERLMSHHVANARRAFFELI